MVKLKLFLLVVSALAVMIPAGIMSVHAETTCNGVPATIIGTPGNDVLVGTEFDDVIVGLGGHDRIVGLEGNDILCGNDGSDNIRGGPGDDLIFIGPGENQYINGDGGFDVCHIPTQDTPAANCEEIVLENTNNKSRAHNDGTSDLTVPSLIPGDIIITDSATGNVIVDTAKLNSRLQVSSTINNTEEPQRVIFMTVEIKDENDVLIIDDRSDIKTVQPLTIIPFNAVIPVETTGSLRLVVSFILDTDGNREAFFSQVFPITVSPISEQFIIEEAVITDLADPANVITQGDTGQGTRIRIAVNNDQSVTQSIFREVTITEPGQPPEVTSTFEYSLRSQDVDTRLISDLIPLRPGAHNATVSYFDNKVDRNQLATVTLPYVATGAPIVLPPQQIQTLEEKVVELEERVAELERRLAEAGIP